MITYLDTVLNHMTAYRMALFYTAALLIAAFGLGFFGLVPAEPTALTFSFCIVLAACWLTNRLFARLFRIPVNFESVYITAFVLALIMPPATAQNLIGVAALVLASVVAVASKFLIAWRRQHLFNPAAIGLAVPMLLIDQPASWWVGGNFTLLPVVLAGGVLVAYKVRQLGTVGAYLVANLAMTLVTTPTDKVIDTILQSLLYSPLLFAGFAMLTEPMTSPRGNWQRMTFGGLVGALSSPNLHFGDFYVTPEVAILVGNLFAWAIHPAGRIKLTLQRIERMASGCYDFVFVTDRAIRFRPGQFSDWTLAVPVADERGNRRTFSFASAPDESEVRLGVKFHPEPSSFKRALAEMQPGDSLFGARVDGDFTLPRAKDAKLAFIADGIGVTPFRGMVQDLLLQQDRRPVVLLYANQSVKEIAYGHIFDRAAAELGLRTVYVVADDAEQSNDVHVGAIDEELIQHEIPDYLERTFYLSGPHSAIAQFRHVLRNLGVANRRIKVNCLTGFA